MKVLADLQLHSRFSRAVSQQMVVPVISSWAAKKGIGLIATGDWTHPLWFRELAANLEGAGEGVYKAKGAPEGSPLFLLSTEVSSIYSQGGKVRKIHTLIFAPNFEVAGKINKELSLRGANLLSDGRPIVGLSAKAVAEIALSLDKRCLVIPAHAWTPWFSLYGSMSGFDSIAECFQELSAEIYAIETGLSSDAAMNWRIADLDNRRIVSFSDAHSPPKLGREATVFEVSEVSFPAIRRAITGEGPDKIAYTIEFYPEEGKYHYTGHRNCNVVYSPNETRKLGTTCPVCGRPLTVGVMSRVEALAKGDVETKSETDKFGVRWIKDKEEKRPPYVMLVPLLEILAEALGSGVGTKTVLGAYEKLTSSLGSEFKILLESSLADIERVAGAKVAEGIEKVRAGDISIEPGYDGVFGKVKIWKEEGGAEDEIEQKTLF
ncbi:DNA helicase UvrD [Candidatus Woesebacteria bacterium]|nr:DNA helicase UvrD [Candidatus Woesebacteria bacterium]